MRVEVTEDDIKNGEADNANSCPIALALACSAGIKRGLDGAVSARISGLYLWRRGHTILLFTPLAPRCLHDMLTIARSVSVVLPT